MVSQHNIKDTRRYRPLLVCCATYKPFNKEKVNLNILFACKYNMYVYVCQYMFQSLFFGNMTEEMRQFRIASLG